MPPDDPSTQLREHGIALLGSVFPLESLARLKSAAIRFFHTIADQRPPHPGFSRTSHSVPVSALLDFGIDREAELLEPLSASGVTPLFSEFMGSAWSCNLEQSWVRKKFAPLHAPATGYHLQNWHQDGALGVRFPPQPGPIIPPASLLTCWIPLDPCGIDSPGLEFVRRRQPALLHFTELDDAALRRRFPPHEFWAPALQPGDGLVFLNHILHRTHVHPEMRHNRLSVEYRIFPC